MIANRLNGEDRIRTSTKNTAKMWVSHERGAESGAVDSRIDDLDLRLAAIIDAWQTLPEAVRDQILALVRDVAT